MRNTNVKFAVLLAVFVMVASSGMALPPPECAPSGCPTTSYDPNWQQNLVDFGNLVVGALGVIWRVLSW
jgi:hypothetical protein